MAKLSIQRTELDNGFRIVAIDMPGRRSMTSFLTIRSGSRYENDANNGVAHFLEHLVFKGTERYPDNEAVAQAIEGVGGTINAWTNFDHTAYWNIVPASAWRSGVAMPFELAFRPRLAAPEMERERSVIIEEIRMYQDDPARHISDLATALLFKGNPLARPIIGTEEIIRTLPIEAFRQYRETHYLPSQAVFVIVGDLGSQDYMEVVNGYVGSLSAGPVTYPEPLGAMSQQQIHVHEKKTDQTHFILGVADPALGLKAEQDRYAAIVLNNLLGQGMSSRLFLQVREKQGLAYAISSYYDTLEDAGSLTVYGGVNTDNVAQALRSVRQELSRLQNELVPSAELKQAKAHVNGAYDISADNPIHLATWYGTDWLLGRWETHDQVEAAINQVTSQQIRELAQRLFQPEHLTLAVIGPHQNDQVFVEALNATV